MRPALFRLTLCICLATLFASGCQSLQSALSSEAREKKALELAQQGNLIKAEEELKIAISLAARESGPKAGNVGRMQAELGDIYVKDGKLEDAEDAFRRSLAVFSEKPDLLSDADRRAWIGCLTSLATLLRQTNREDEAKVRESQAQTLREKLGQSGTEQATGGSAEKSAGQGPAGSTGVSPAGAPAGSPGNSPAGAPAGSPGNSPAGVNAGSPGNSSAGATAGSPGNSPAGATAGSSGNSPAGATAGSPGNSPAGAPAGSSGNSPAGATAGSPGNSPAGATAGSPGHSPAGANAGSPGNSAGQGPASSTGSPPAQSSTGSSGNTPVESKAATGGRTSRPVGGAPTTAE